jgi:hypothetical protein
LAPLHAYHHANVDTLDVTVARQVDGQRVLPPGAAIETFQLSGLGPEVLALVWDVSLWQNLESGNFSPPEFVVAMHLLQLARQGVAVPPALPPELYTSAEGGQAAAPLPTGAVPEPPVSASALSRTTSGNSKSGGLPGDDADPAVWAMAQSQLDAAEQERRQRAVAAADEEDRSRQGQAEAILARSRQAVAETMAFGEEMANSPRPADSDTSCLDPPPSTLQVPTARLPQQPSTRLAIVAAAAQLPECSTTQAARSGPPPADDPFMSPVPAVPPAPALAVANDYLGASVDHAFDDSFGAASPSPVKKQQQPGDPAAAPGTAAVGGRGRIESSLFGERSSTAAAGALFRCFLGQCATCDAWGRDCFLCGRRSIRRGRHASKRRSLFRRPVWRRLTIAARFVGTHRH